jgi:hypothetical protein
MIWIKSLLLLTISVLLPSSYLLDGIREYYRKIVEFKEVASEINFPFKSLMTLKGTEPLPIGYTSFPSNN